MVTSMSCQLRESNERRRKYTILNESDKIFGYIVVEKYGDTWNIELMEIIIRFQRQGHGSVLLNYALNDLKSITDVITVCAITDEGRGFFAKHGFVNGQKRI